MLTSHSMHTHVSNVLLYEFAVNLLTQCTADVFTALLTVIRSVLDAVHLCMYGENNMNMAARIIVGHSTLCLML